MAGRLYPEEVRDVSGEGPHLRRGQASIEQPPDHKVSLGVATVRRKLQGQFLGCSEFSEDRRGLLWLDANRGSVGRQTAAPEPPGYHCRYEDFSDRCVFGGSPNP